MNRLLVLTFGSGGLSMDFIVIWCLLLFISTKSFLSDWSTMIRSFWNASLMRYSARGFSWFSSCSPTVRLSELGESLSVSYFFPRMNTLLRAISLRSSLENRAFYAIWKYFCCFMKWTTSSSLKILALALSIAFWFLLPLKRNERQLSLNRTGLLSFIRSIIYFYGMSLLFVELLLSKMLVIRYF